MAKRVRKTSQQPQSGNRATCKRAERVLKSRLYDDIGVTRGVAIPVPATGRPRARLPEEEIGLDFCRSMNTEVFFITERLFFCYTGSLIRSLVILYFYETRCVHHYR